MTNPALDPAADPPPLVLASGSPARRMLLERLGLPFEVDAPDDVDEEAVKARGGAPDAIARALARLKAERVAARRPDALVIGSDQVAALTGEGGAVELLGKPGTEERAAAQLRRLSGRTLRLLTAVAVIDPTTGAVHEALEEHAVRFRPLDEAALRDYVRRDQPLGCAGSFRLEGLGVALMERCEGGDYTAVIGLPLMAVTRLLEACGVRVLGRR